MGSQHRGNRAQREEKNKSGGDSPRVSKKGGRGLAARGGWQRRMRIQGREAGGARRRTKRTSTVKSTDERMEKGTRMKEGKKREGFRRRCAGICRGGKNPIERKSNVVPSPHIGEKKSQRG